MQMNTINKIKLALGLLLAAICASFLIYKTNFAGSNTENGNWDLFLERRGCDPIEYEELYQDCVAIKHILESMIDLDINPDLLAVHIYGYLIDSVNTDTSHILYEDIKNIDFDI